MIAFKFATVDRDLGAKAILSEMEAVKSAAIHTGLFAGDKHPGATLGLAEIGTVHEYGSPKMNIPERSWLRRAGLKNAARWKADVAKALDRIVSSRGRTSAKATLLYLGEMFASDVRRTIDRVTMPPKAPATLAREGAQYTHPLIWLGYMRAAVRSRLTMKGSTSFTGKGGR